MSSQRHVDRKDGLPLEMISENNTDNELDDGDDGGDRDEQEDSEEPGDSPQAPKHPIPSMQGPFEESIWESEQRETNGPDARAMKLNAKARHQRLLENKNYNSSYNALWRQNPSSKYHPMTKIIAQLVFGIHLLHAQLAKSDEEVVIILQRHVDEVDNFIQRTGEDFDHALADIEERINYLRLPLQHVNIFDVMLDDRNFRAQIIDGNEKIEQIVTRTAELMNDLLVDINKGISATKEMSEYLEELEDHWPDDPNNSIEVYDTMRSNAEGWLECFRDLHMKGNSLGVALVQLGSILNEMSKRAGVASRRSVPNSRPGSSNSTQAGRNVRFQNPRPQSRFSRTMVKPLPDDPDTVACAVQATLPQRDHVSHEEGAEYPRPPGQLRSAVKRPTPLREEIRNEQPLNPETAELTTFLRNTAPAKSTEVFPDDEDEGMTALPKIRPRGVESRDQEESGSLLRRTSSRLKRRTHEARGERVKSPVPRETLHSPVPDSAYSSDSKGSSGKHRRKPSTRPASLLAGTISSPASRAGFLGHGKFSLFPSATPSMCSAMASEVSLPLNHGKSSGLSHQMPSRPDSAPANGNRRLKKKSSISALKRFFWRRNGNRFWRRRLDVVQEIV